MTRLEEAVDSWGEGEGAGFHTLLDAGPGYSLVLPPSDPGPSQAIVPPTVGMPFFMKRPFCSRDDAARHDDHLFQTVDGLLDVV